MKNIMFGFFKKKTPCTQEILSVVYIQNDSMKKWMKLFNAATGQKDQQEDKSVLESICGKWLCPDMGICLQIRKEENAYYVCLADAKDPLDFKISYAIRTYKGMSYFVFSGYAIFIECDRDSNRMSLGENLPFIRKVAGSTIPFTQY